MARLSKANAVKHLRDVLNEIPELKELPYDSPRYEQWRNKTRLAITYTFGKESNHAGIPRDLPLYQLIVLNACSSSLQETYTSVLESAASEIEAMIEEIEMFWEEDELSSTSSNPNDPKSKGKNRGFIVHGHDDSAKEAVARFLEKLGLEPIILHEQPNQGRTIIEKFEDHADVAFAVVLLTPDDVGGLRDEPLDLKPRARQNVILELGFFLGKLGRQRVCPLVKGDVETPSDYDGVVYTKLDDAGGWQMKLVKELKAVGFDVDANKAI